MKEQEVQRCSECGNPTGKCEEDDLYDEDNGDGPMCEECYDSRCEEKDREALAMTTKVSLPAFLAVMSGFALSERDMLRQKVIQAPDVRLCKICNEECPPNKYCCSAEHFKQWMAKA